MTVKSDEGCRAVHCCQNSLVLLGSADVAFKSSEVSEPRAVFVCLEVFATKHLTSVT